MIYLKSVELNKIIYYKHATLDLDYKGLTVINGSNLNVVSVDQTNACGKSLLVSAISDVIKSTVPVGNNSKRGVPKDLYSEGSSIELNIELDNGKQYSVKKFLKGKSVKFNILEDGVDTEIRTPSLAIDELQKIFPISDQEYFTLYHLDSRRPFDLQLGTQATRHSFFSDLFKLNDFDSIKEMCDTHIRELKDDTVRQEMLISDSISLTKEVSGFDITSEESYKKLNTKFNKARDRHGQLVTRLSDLNLIESHKDQIEFISNYDMNLKEVKRELTLLEKEADSYIKYLAHRKVLKTYNEKYTSAYSKLSNLSSEVQKEFGTTEVDNITSELESLRDIQEERTSLVRTIKRLRSDIIDCEKPDTKSDRLLGLTESEEKTLKKLMDDRYLNLTRSKELEGRIDSLKKHKEGNNSECITCGSELSDDTVDSLLELCSEKMKKYNHIRKESVRKKCEIENRLVSYKDDIDTWVDINANNLIRKEIKELKAKLPDKVDYKKSKELATQYTKIYNQLHVLEKPTWKKDIPDNVVDRVKELNKFCTMTESTKVASRLLKTYGKDISSVTTDILKYEKELDTVNKITGECQEKISALKASIITYKKDVKRLDKLNTQISELETVLKDISVYKLLQGAYSNKGIKTLVMNTIANSISDNMNKYSSLLFTEPMEFSIDIAPNVFDILVARGKGKRRVSDVRNLSGSESRCFNVLLAISVLPMIPRKNRLNIMILDEMTANLSEVSRDLFINNFLPVLTQIVPHVIIVTPDNDVYPDARTFVATKKGNETKLIER